MFNVVICTVNRTTQTDGIQREKAALNSHWENSVSFDFSFSVEERPDFIHAIAANKRADSHNFKIKNIYLQLLSSPFA